MPILLIIVLVLVIFWLAVPLLPILFWLVVLIVGAFLGFLGQFLSMFF